MSATDTADVAVVGAGPAGAWAAVRLARSGARVVVFDHSHPREKPCGGGVTGRALQLVSGEVAIDRLPGVAAATASFAVAGARPATVSLASHGVGADSSLVIIDRRRFDAALLEAAEAAGARHVAARVLDVEVDESGCRLRTTSDSWRARVLVGADGANSLVRRRVSRPFTRGQLSIATGFFAHGPTSSEIAVEFEADPPGYIWSFPRRDHLAIGICAQADVSTSDRLRRRVARWTAEFGQARDARLQRYSWPIPSLAPGDWAQERPAGPRWALVGDAAGLVDPLTREGIFFALRSADLLASALCCAAPGALDRYAAALQREVVAELRHAARLKQGFFRGRFTRLLVDALRHSPAVARIMADLVAGRQPYATLKRRLLATLEVGLAWQLLKLEVRGRLARRGRVTPGPGRAVNA